MSIRNLVIIFLILALVPVFLGKVQFQFGGFFQSPSWPGFKTAFTNLISDDFNYYKGLVTSLIGNFVKEKIKEAVK